LSDAYKSTTELLELALTRAARPPSESVEITRNAKGDVQFSVAGSVHDDETLEQCANRVAAVYDALEKAYPRAEVVK